ELTRFRTQSGYRTGSPLSIGPVASKAAWMARSAKVAEAGSARAARSPRAAGVAINSPATSVIAATRRARDTGATGTSFLLVRAAREATHHRSEGPSIQRPEGSRPGG